MGEIADAILNGDMDCETGEWLGRGEGYPRTASHSYGFGIAPTGKAAPKIACPICSKKAKESGLNNHMKDAHKTSVDYFFIKLKDEIDSLKKRVAEIEKKF